MPCHPPSLVSTGTDVLLDVTKAEQEVGVKVIDAVAQAQAVTPGWLPTHPDSSSPTSPIHSVQALRRRNHCATRTRKAKKEMSGTNLGLKYA